MAGVTVGTAALIIVLSVFNGLEEMVRTIFNTSDPDLIVTPVEGKTFIPTEKTLSLITSVEGVQTLSSILEENVLLKYDDRQYIAVIKGVESNYSDISGLDSAMWDGKFLLQADNGRPYAIVGLGVASYLGLNINFLTPLNIYVPRRTAQPGAGAESAFTRMFIFPSGIFSVEQEFDSRYVIVPISFARELLDYESDVTSLEIKLTPGTNVNPIQKEIRKIIGEEFEVKNRLEQQEIFYKVMRSERLAIFIILTFIIIIASFNVIASLTMLIIEKEKDIGILKSLGADKSLIRKIFIFEGWMISLFGALLGLILGFLICWAQQKFGLVKLQGESLIMDSYPVVMSLNDFVVVLGTVVAIGYWAAWYPVRYLTRKYLADYN